MAALTFDDAQELVRYIVLHPELQAQLRPVILSAELLDLPDLVRRNSEAIDRLTERMDESNSRMDAFGERMDQLAERMDQLTVRMDHLTVRVDQLTERVDALGREVQALTAAVNKGFARHDDAIGELRGDVLENWYERRMRPILGRLVRHPIITGVDRLDGVESALAANVITEQDWDSLVQADMLVTGSLGTDRKDILLVVEISHTIDQHDIERAAARARLLEKCGYRAVGVAAGKLIRPEEIALGEASGVAVILGTRILHWPTAA